MGGGSLPEIFYRGSSGLRSARERLEGLFDGLRLRAVVRLHFFAQVADEVGVVFLLRLIVGGANGVRRGVGLDAENHVRIGGLFLVAGRGRGRLRRVGRDRFGGLGRVIALALFVVRAHARGL